MSRTELASAPSWAASGITSGVPAVDRYLDEGFLAVRGMSSRFATAISAWCLDHQAEQGIVGHFAEIGTFQGRYFIAQALALRSGERALGIDLFDWPTSATEAIFRDNCANWGVTEPVLALWKAHSAQITAADLHSRLGDDQPVRFFHIDGEHAPEPLQRDLDLALSVLHPQGLICLDDMLHPGYPLLVAVVDRWLKAHPHMRLMAVIDREDIVAAPKFMLCDAEAVGLYDTALMARFAPWQFMMGGDAQGHHCVVLTPFPRLAEVD